MAALQTQQDHNLYRKYVEAAFRQYQNRQDIKMYTELILTSFTIIVFSIFAIKPTLSTIITLYKDMKAKEATISQMDQKILSLDQAKSLYTDNEQNIQALNQAIPDKPFPEKFIRQIEGISQNHDVLLVNIDLNEAEFSTNETESQTISNNSSQIKSPSTDQLEQEQLASIRATSQYSNLTSFLKDIENMQSPYKFLIPTISLFTNRETEELILEIEGSLQFLPL